MSAIGLSGHQVVRRTCPLVVIHSEAQQAIAVGELSCSSAFDGIGPESRVFVSDFLRGCEVR
jgi:hypothetical protein